MVQVELGDMMISSKNPVEVEHVGSFHDKVISNDNQSVHIDQLLKIYILAREQERRVIKAPVKLGFKDVVVYPLMIGCVDPTSYKEVINNKDTSK